MEMGWTSRANVDLGAVTGHETCGTIIGVGEGVRIESENQLMLNATLHVGLVHVAKRMPMYARMALFRCSQPWGLCLTFNVPSINARTNPSDLSLPLASIQDPLGSAIHTLTGGPVEGSTIAIHGLGPIGLFSVMVAKMMGAEKIIAVDWDNKFRMDLATRLGADVVLGKDDDVVHSILEQTDGRVLIIHVNFLGRLRR